MNPKIDTEGVKRWYNEQGEVHREDGPAVEYPNGQKNWYRHNQIHREDGPAIEYPNGDESWYQNSVRHREDGPALKWKADATNLERIEYWYKGEHIKIIKNDKQWKTYLNCKLFW
jgi:hypothetical protein